VFRQRKPVLAICRGHQLLNVALGGTLIVDIPTELPHAQNHSRPDRRFDIVHDARLTADSLLAKIIGTQTLGVNSTHHQAVGRVAPPLQVVARSDDGVVEAMELKPEAARWLPFLLSVQFHPERLAERHPEHRAIFDAFARACASRARLPLYRHFAAILDREPGSLPRPFINLFSGGKHAGGQVALQDVQIVAPSARTMADALRLTAAVYQAAIERIAVRYRARPLAADEGGLAPDFPDSAAMLADTVAAIEAAGLRPGADMAIALDAAASHFYADGLYHLDGRALSTDGLIAALTGWLDAYPIVSVEDGLSEDDWDGWARWRQAAAGRALILGDDLLCTNVTRIQRAIDRGTADALLLKVNQVGTLTEAAAAFRLARAAGWRIVVSARSGETEDDWLADLAVGWGGDHIKVGAITRSERLAKYNRLLEIEAETGWPLTPLNPAGT
jgi:enolase